MPLRILDVYANRLRDKLVPLRRTEIDGIKFYFTRGNEPQDPRAMGQSREMYRELDQFSGGMAIDIGAHIGSYTLRLARRFRTVVAFEPNPFNRYILGLNLKMNKIFNVRLEDAALSDREESGRLFIHRAADGTGSLNPVHYGFKYDKTVQVNVRKLDHFDFSNVDVLKIDAEGNELPILKGATSTIKRCLPIIALEVHCSRRPDTGACECETCAYVALQNYDSKLLGEYSTTPVHWVLATPRHRKKKDQI